MAERKSQSKKLSPTSSKKEMLDAYNDLALKLEEQRESELKPEEKKEERVVKEATAVADALSIEGVEKDISRLKSDMGKLLTDLTDKLGEEVHKYGEIKKAIVFREKELGEIFEIQRAASSLAALLETQRRKREEFEAEMASRKEELTAEIEETKAEWEREMKSHEEEMQAQSSADLKKCQREEEEFRYAFARKQKLTEDELSDKKAKLEKELIEKTKEWAKKEDELKDLQNRVALFPKELETSVMKAVEQATEKIKFESKSREEMLKKEFSGEKGVLTTKIQALEQSVNEQSSHIVKLTEQLEKSYSQVQDIAVKAVEGSSSLKSLASFQQFTEQARTPRQER